MSDAQEENNGNSTGQDEVFHREMDIFDHLDELRRRLIWIVVTVSVGSFGGWFLTNPVFKFLTLGGTQKLQYFAPTDALFWRFKLAFIIGVIITSPMIITQIWLFIRPGLTASERKFAFPAISSATLLFFIGSGFASYILPVSLKILQKFGGDFAKADYSIDRYIGFVGMFLIGSGIVFETPVVLVLLAKLGIVTYEQLAANRKTAMIVAVVVGAIITPTVDPVNMFLLASPLYLLYEASLIIIKLMDRKKRKEESPG